MRVMRYQPQGRVRINTRNPLTLGLVLSMQAGAGVRDVISGQGMSGRGSAQSIKAFDGGLAYDNRAVNSAAFVSAAGLSGALVGDQTVVFDLVLSGAYSGNAPAIGGLWRTTTQNDSWLTLDRTSVDGLTLNFRIGGVSSSRTFAIGASSLYGKRIIIAASIYRGEGRIVRLRVAADGQVLLDLEASYSASGDANVTPTGTEYVSIGSESIENATRNPNCIIYSQHHFSRVLDAREVASLSAAQWQLFAAPNGGEVGAPTAPGGSALIVTPAALLLGGGEVAMRVSRRVGVQAAAMAVSGGSVTLRAARQLGVQPGALMLTGGGAGLKAARLISATAAGLTLQTGAAQLRASRRLTVAPVDMAVTAGTLQFQYAPAPAAGSYAIAVSPAALSLSGGNVEMRVTRRIPVAGAGLAISSGEARLLAGRRILVAPAMLECAVGEVILRADRRLQVTPAQLVAAGGAVVLRYSQQIEYARAPDGFGYPPQRVEIQARPAQLGGSRPASIQRNNR
ncbi:hypothetical protein IM543_11235 [Massilia sp. UMI-21]|nr:hypothetical protein IM543_11235 [Massilia sp. UMI-21]